MIACFSATKIAGDARKMRVELLNPSRPTLTGAACARHELTGPLTGSAWTVTSPCPKSCTRRTPSCARPHPRLRPAFVPRFGTGRARGLGLRARVRGHYQGNGARRDEGEGRRPVLVPFNIACGGCVSCKQEMYGNATDRTWRPRPWGPFYGYSHTGGGYTAAELSTCACPTPTWAPR